MSAEFIEECRREWKRLGVPEPAADDMAAELGADLDEAAADGVAATELLGEDAFDARRFAASWAEARGVVPAVRRGRSRLLVIPAMAVAAVVIAGGILLSTRATSKGQQARPPGAHPHHLAFARPGVVPVVVVSSSVVQSLPGSTSTLVEPAVQVHRAH